MNIMAPFISASDATRKVFERVNAMVGSQDVKLPLQPPIDIFMREDGRLAFVVLMLPGASREQLELTINDAHLLLITGKLQRPAVEQQHSAHAVHTECSWGAFVREVALDEGTVESDCSAKFENGMLVVEIRTDDDGPAFSSAQIASQATIDYFKNIFATSPPLNIGGLQKEEENKELKAEGEGEVDAENGWVDLQ